MIQKFLPAVAEGDKRIILVDGEPLGAVNRVPVGDDIRSNMVRGGAARETELTPREREICARIGPELKRRGLIFVGIDVIDGYLTEINVTSPTGLRAIQRLGGPNLAAAIWDVIEAKRRASSRSRAMDQRFARAPPRASADAPQRRPPTVRPRAARARSSSARRAHADDEAAFRAARGRDLRAALGARPRRGARRRSKRAAAAAPAPSVSANIEDQLIRALHRRWRDARRIRRRSRQRAIV